MATTQGAAEDGQATSSEVKPAAAPRMSNQDAKKAAQELHKAIDEMAHVVVGQKEVIMHIMIALLADGHVLLEGVPGLAKTLMVRTLANVLDASFARVQFTPDLLPSDIIGTKIFNSKSNEFTTQKGPIFAQCILADEINRAPPKVQSALLEAMQERQVTISGDTFELPDPFLVMATQNPVETEGTYHLPEAQVDRFMFKILVGYPTHDEEKMIIRRETGKSHPEAKRILTTKKIKELQETTRDIYADESIESYIADLVDATRNPGAYELELQDSIELGASPRASIWMMLGAKAHALLDGRGFVTPDDVKAVASHVLRHRIMLTYVAEAEGMTSDDIVQRILDGIQSP